MADREETIAIISILKRWDHLVLRHQGQEREKIPLKYKCSRCKRDLRVDCRCNTGHPQTPNRSGNNILRTNSDYHGGYSE